MSIFEQENDIVSGLIDLSEMPPLVEETPIQEICRILDQLVKEKGADYIYPFSGTEDGTTTGDCRYVDFVHPDGKVSYAYWIDDDDDDEEEMALKASVTLAPSCIVGYLVSRVGIDLEDLLMVNQESVDSAWNSLPRRWREYELNGDPDGLRQALGELQASQDRGVSWGKSVARFKAEVGIDG